MKDRSMRNIAVMMMLLTLAVFSVQAGDEALPGLLQNARLLLDQPTPDSSALVAIGAKLEQRASEARSDEQRDQICEILQSISRAASPSCEGWALTMCLRYPESPCIEVALHSVWPVGADASTQLQVADALLNMAGLNRDKSWSVKYEAALFRAYAQEGWWQSASLLGDRILKNGYALDDGESLSLANAYLRSKREDDARAALFDLSMRTEEGSPEAVRAAVELGLIEQVYHREAQAKLQFEQAWQSWSKSKRKPGFQSDLVSRSAARARWELYDLEAAALQKRLEVSLEWREKDVKKWIKEFEQSGDELLTLAPEYRAAVEFRMGDVQRATGDGLLRLGLYSTRPADQMNRDKLLEKGLQAYQAGLGFYQLAASHDNVEIDPLLEGHWAELVGDYSVKADQEQYILLEHAADQLANWSYQLWKNTPLRSFGDTGYSERFHAILDDALPVLMMNLDYRNQARVFALRHRELESVNTSPEYVWKDLTEPLQELLRICAGQWQTSSATATQIARTLHATTNPAAVESLTEHFAEQISSSREFGRDVRAELDKLFDQLLTYVPEREPLVPLAETRLAFFREYAAMDRTIHDFFSKAVDPLDRRDPDVAPIRSVLIRHSNAAATIEMETLEAGQEWAEAQGFLGDQSRTLYARLAERDPIRFPIRNRTMQATR